MISVFVKQQDPRIQHVPDCLLCKLRIAEHVEEDGLGEGVESREGGAALGPQRVRFVQDLRNPPLLGEGR